jgi:hypothetical protein
LDVIGAEASAVLEIIYVWVSDKYANRPAIVNHLVQPLRGGESHYGNGPWNHHTIPAFYEFDMKENFVTKALA